MKKLRLVKLVRWLVLGMMIILTLLLRYVPGWGEWYARECYPYLSGLLSSFSSLFSFSLGDCFVVAGILWIAGSLVYGICCRKRIAGILLRIFEFSCWVFVWFYLAWGINYFRSAFYERNEIEKKNYSPESFKSFLIDYVNALNTSYVMAGDSLANWYVIPSKNSGFVDSLNVEHTITNQYGYIAPGFGLISPRDGWRAKPMLWSRGMSKVGVTGYMGPFFAEFNLNGELLNVEYPFTYAHELAHRLGIANEAEANLYAYLACTRSLSPEIQFSGYFSLLGYVMGNARRLLTDVEYNLLRREINSGVVDLYKSHLEYWRGKYSPRIGSLQNRLYNFYLKSNEIESGTKNYSEVVGLLISLKESGKM